MLIEAISSSLTLYPTGYFLQTALDPSSERSAGFRLVEALFHPFDFHRLKAGFFNVIGDFLVGDRLALALLQQDELAGEIDMHVGNCGMFLKVGKDALRTERADHAVDRGLHRDHPVRRGQGEGGG